MCLKGIQSRASPFNLSSGAVVLKRDFRIFIALKAFSGVHEVAILSGVHEVRGKIDQTSNKHITVCLGEHAHLWKMLKGYMVRESLEPVAL